MKSVIQGRAEQLQFEETRQELPQARRSTEPEGKHGAPGARRRAAAELLATRGALLNRTHLRDLGLERRAIDAVFRSLPVVALPGYSRPMIRAEAYLELV